MKTPMAAVLLITVVLQLVAHLNPADASVVRENTMVRWDKLERPDLVRSVLQYHQKKVVNNKEEKNINIRIIGGTH